MPNTNGHKPQHHLSAREIVEAQRLRQMKPWHSATLDIDFLIRPRTGAEIAALSDDSQRIMADAELYKGTSDAPGSIEQLRLGLRSAVPVMLDPDTKLPYFGVDEVEDLLDLPMDTINELMQAANEGSGFTATQAEEARKNSVTTDDGATSSVSPSDPATPTSSPTPIR